MEKQISLLPPGIQHLLAGGGGGVCSIIVGHPFDTIKVRLQTMPKDLPGEKPMFTGAFDCARCAIKREGLLALYKGFAPPLMIAMPSSALCFWGFNLGMNLQQNETGEQLRLPRVFLAGMLGGLAQQVIAVPGERVKCLLQVQQDRRGDGKYRGTFDCVKTVLRNEGLRGMFLGMGAGIARDVPANGVYFFSYQIVLRYILGDGRAPADVRPLEVALAGGTAGVMYWLSAIPMDVLKSRYVTAPAGTYPRGIRDVFRVTIKQEGFRAFGKGAAPVMIRAFPSNVATFLGYEYSLKLISWCSVNFTELATTNVYD